MRRDHLAWIVSLALGAMGWMSAHALAYRLAAPDPHERERMLAASGHGFLGYGPFLLLLLLVLTSVCAAAFLLQGVGAGRRPRASLVFFGSLPPFAFAVLEHGARLFVGGDAHATVIAPACLAGLALQVPFAFIAVLFGRALLRVTDAIGSELGGTRRPRLVPLVLSSPQPRAASALPARILTGVRGQRAPPFSLLA